MTRERKANRTSAQKAQDEVDALQARLLKLQASEAEAAAKSEAYNVQINAVQARLDYAKMNPDLMPGVISKPVGVPLSALS